MLERQAAQQRVAAHATVYQLLRERPGMAQQPAVYKSESTDLQTARRSAREYEWQEEQRVLWAQRMAHVHIPGSGTLAQTMRRHENFGAMRLRHDGSPAARPACRVTGAASNAGMGESRRVDVVARKGADGCAVLQLHLPLTDDDGTGSELCAVLDLSNCEEPRVLMGQVLAPPGYTGK